MEESSYSEDESNTRHLKNVNYVTDSYDTDEVSTGTSSYAQYFQSNTGIVSEDSNEDRDTTAMSSEILTETEVKSNKTYPGALEVGVKNESEIREPAKPSDAALKFLKSINHNMLEYCCFEDKLVLVSDDGKSVGEYRASVEQTIVDDEEVLFIRASVNGKVDDIPTISSLTAYILPENLTLLKQEHRQFCKTSEKLEIITKLELNRETCQIEVRRTITQGKTLKTTRLKYKKHAINGLVTEATNIILQRLLIRAGVELENMDFVSLDINARRLVATTYRTLGAQKQMIGRRETEVYGIERKLHLTNDLTTWNSFFTEKTLITFKVQAGTPLAMIIDRIPLPTLAQCSFESKPLLEKQSCPSLPITEDLELRSKLIKRKTEIKSEHNSFLLHHPEAKALLSDFLQNVLLRRPQDVVKFAAKYFSDFSSKPSDIVNMFEKCFSGTAQSVPSVVIDQSTSQENHAYDNMTFF